MDYSDKITESLDTLRALEKQQTKPKYRDYVRFIRLLKEKMATTQQQAAQLLNLSLRQVQRLWQKYQHKGLMVMIQPRQATHLGKLSCTQITQLRQFLCTNQASSQADIRTFLADSFQINYTISGISELCKRLNIKHKVVRPVHARQEPGAVDAFKKNGQPLRADYADEAILFHDELRAGTRTELGRKWSPTGHRSVGRVLIGYQYVYLYLALCPFTGRGYASASAVRFSAPVVG